MVWLLYVVIPVNNFSNFTLKSNKNWTQCAYQANTQPKLFFWWINWLCVLIVWTQFLPYSMCVRALPNHTHNIHYIFLSLLFFTVFSPHSFCQLMIFSFFFNIFIFRFYFHFYFFFNVVCFLFFSSLLQRDNDFNVAWLNFSPRAPSTSVEKNKRPTVQR